MATVLIVDDSLVMRMNLRSLFEQAGYMVIAEATDGLEAFNKYGELMPDYVTMDINMPRLNGIDAVKKILGSYPDAKIIMISAIDEKDKVIEAIRSGAKHYILKPVNYEKVLEIMKHITSKKA